MQTPWLPSRPTESEYAFLARFLDEYDIIIWEPLVYSFFEESIGLLGYLAL